MCILCGEAENRGDAGVGAGVGVGVDIRLGQDGVG